MFQKRKHRKDIEFEEIFLDSSNLPSFNRGRLEGRLELPITKRNIYIVGVFFLLLAIIFFGKVFSLQVIHGSEYKERSENNQIDKGVIIAERGVIYDRNGELLAWNEFDTEGKYPFPVRAYINEEGLGQVIGYVSYPQKDKHGFYFQTEYLGRTGVEYTYNKILSGKNGERLIEIDAHNKIVSDHAIDPPQAGLPITLSVDHKLSEAMYKIIATSTNKAYFRSGAGVIMDVSTGEILAMTSFPSYDPEVMSDGDDLEKIESYNQDSRFPFLNKVVGGVYTPGSIVKPFIAIGALQEKIISPDKIITSYGYIDVPNRYDPENPTRFNDWRVQGPMDMRKAIAFSSNVYFYIIGGGFDGQEGLGITRINKYMNLFGFGSTTAIRLLNEQVGTVPNPAWKKRIFDDDWRLGDTYHTAIGQFGFQVTPIQMVRAYAAIANGGKLFTPHLDKGRTSSFIDLGLNHEDLSVVREGMRMTVNFDGGTARALERHYVSIAAKSGTAELGASKAKVNTWAAGYFPYENPKYAFVLLMESGPRANQLGATRVMGDVVEWMYKNTPEYLGVQKSKIVAE